MGPGATVTVVTKHRTILPLIYLYLANATGLQLSALEATNTGDVDTLN